MKVLIYAEGEIAKIITTVFGARPEYQIVATLTSIDALRREMAAHKQVVIICDVTKSMSVLNSLEDEIKQKNLKILCISKTVSEGFNGLSKGAVEMAVLPDDIGNTGNTMNSFGNIIRSKVNKIYKEYDVEDRVLKKVYTFNKSTHKIITIGSSTGGTEVMLEILKDLPADVPPILIVQHMPAVFTQLYAKRLNTICKMTVWEAQDGDEVRPGLALLAPGNRQMRIEQRGGKYVVTCRKEEKVGGHMPSVDVLFKSVAKEVGGNAIAVMLTGMGRDGAEGMLELRQKGAYTIGQDEKSCMVYGMPKAAYDIGAVQIQANIPDISKLIMKNK